MNTKKNKTPTADAKQTKMGTQKRENSLKTARNYDIVTQVATKNAKQLKNTES